jgi:hypothetical protein
MPRPSKQIQSGKLITSVASKLQKENPKLAEYSNIIPIVIQDVLMPGMLRGVSFKTQAEARDKFLHERPDLFYEVAGRAWQVKAALGKPDKRKQIESFFHQWNAFVYRRGQGGVLTYLSPLRWNLPHKIPTSNNFRVAYVDGEEKMTDEQLVEFLTALLRIKITVTDISKARLNAHKVSPK